MKNYICFLLFFSMLCLSPKVLGQKEEANYTIGVQLPYLANGGLRVDMDKRLSSREWLQFSVTGYFLGERTDDEHYWASFNSNNEDFSSLKGAGLGAAYKAYFKKKPSSTPRFYFSTGLYYTHYNVSYKTGGYNMFLEEGLNYWRYELVTKSAKYNKFNTNFCIGFQNPPIKNNFFIDFYLGIGYSYSFYNKNENPFYTDVFSFGYRGIEPVGGLRMGLAF